MTKSSCPLNPAMLAPETPKSPNPLSTRSNDDWPPFLSLEETPPPGVQVSPLATDSPPARGEWDTSPGVTPTQETGTRPPEPVERTGQIGPSGQIPDFEENVGRQAPLKSPAIPGHLLPNRSPQPAHLHSPFSNRESTLSPSVDLLSTTGGHFQYLQCDGITDSTPLFVIPATTPPPWPVSGIPIREPSENPTQPPSHTNSTNNTDHTFPNSETPITWDLLLNSPPILNNPTYREQRARRARPFQKTRYQPHRSNNRNTSPSPITPPPPNPPVQPPSNNLENMFQYTILNDPDLYPNLNNPNPLNWTISSDPIMRPEHTANTPVSTSDPTPRTPTVSATVDTVERTVQFTEFHDTRIPLSLVTTLVFRTYTHYDLVTRFISQPSSFALNKQQATLFLQLAYLNNVYFQYTTENRFLGMDYFIYLHQRYLSYVHGTISCILHMGISTPFYEYLQHCQQIFITNPLLPLRTLTFINYNPSQILQSITGPEDTLRVHLSRA